MRYLTLIPIYKGGFVALVFDFVGTKYLISSSHYYYNLQTCLVGIARDRARFSNYKSQIHIEESII